MSLSSLLSAARRWWCFLVGVTSQRARELGRRAEKARAGACVASPWLAAAREERCWSNGRGQRVSASADSAADHVEWASGDAPMVLGEIKACAHRCQGSSGVGRSAADYVFVAPRAPAENRSCRADLSCEYRSLRAFYSGHGVSQFARLGATSRGRAQSPPRKNLATRPGRSSMHRVRPEKPSAPGPPKSAAPARAKMATRK